MSREMLPPPARMRLTVEVLDLTDDNSFGYRRPQDFAAFKSRKFALPVQSEDTFEKVWKAIEHRYKTNYLDERQAASFTIKKLQDAYDCDLDLGDTVSSIFEGETDPAKRMIKVVPSFIDRDLSVPVTSNLRPGLSLAQKRIRQVNEEHANKRRRVEKTTLPSIHEEQHLLRDQPVPTTESEPSVIDHDEDNVGRPRAGSQARRSHTGGSLVVVSNAQTGNREFGPGVKEESPELALPPAKPAARLQSPGQIILESHPSTTSEPLAVQDPPRMRSKSPLVPPQHPQSELENGMPQINDEVLDHVPVQDEVAQDKPEQVSAPSHDPQDVAIHPSTQSPASTVLQTPLPATARRRDIYDVPSSPEFLERSSGKAKSKAKTYAKSPRATKLVQKEVDMLNSSRRFSAGASARAQDIPQSLTKKVRAFNLPATDEIESSSQENTTQKAYGGVGEEEEDGDIDLTTVFLNTTGHDFQDGFQTPPNTATRRRGRPGSLKKPTKPAVAATPTSKPRDVQVDSSSRSRSKDDNTGARLSQVPIPSTPGSSGSKSAKVAPAIQARLDALKLRQSQRHSSPRVTVSTRQESIHSDASSVPASTNAPNSRNDEQGRNSIPPPHEDNSSHVPTSGERKPIALDNTTPLSVQPLARPTSTRSPVPLPENVRHLADDGKLDTQSKPTKVASIFQKPMSKVRSSASTEQSDSATFPSASTNGVKTQHGFTSSWQASAPASQNLAVKSHLEPSDSIDSNTSARSQLSNHPQSVTLKDTAPSAQAAMTQDTPPSAQAPRKRGRPRKIDSAPTTKQTIKQTFKQTAKQADQLSSPSRGIEPKSPGNQEPKSDLDSTVATEAIIISSAESSSGSSNDPRSDREEQGEGLTASVKKPAVSKQSSNTPPITDSDKLINSKTEQRHLNDRDPGKSAAIKSSFAMPNTDQPPVSVGAANVSSTTQSELVPIRLADAHPAPMQKRPVEHSPTWSFGNLEERDGTAVNGGTSKIRERRATSPPIPMAETVGSVHESENDVDEYSDDIETRSVRTTSSTRSSPAMVRQPARFLSHSPTPGGSASEDESDGTSSASLKPSLSPEAPVEQESESDSTSESDSSDSEEEEEDEEMPDAPTHPVLESVTGRTANIMPSSPPLVQPAPNSTPLIPETSQPSLSQLPRKTPVPLPPNMQPRSSQSVSELAANRPNIRRPHSFTPLSQQLAQAKATAPAAQKKVFDARNVNLAKLAAKGGASKKLTLPTDDDDSSDDDDETSESSDSD